MACNGHRENPAEPASNIPFIRDVISGCERSLLKLVAVHLLFFTVSSVSTKRQRVFVRRQKLAAGRAPKKI